jgi:hypothetical protein
MRSCYCYFLTVRTEPDRFAFCFLILMMCMILLLLALLAAADSGEMCSLTACDRWRESDCSQATLRSRSSESYPLTADMLARSIPYEAKVSRLFEIIQHAESGGSLNVVVLGGSVTLGHHAYKANGQPCAGSECSWVARFEEWALRRFPHASVSVQNRALSACASSCQVSLLGTKLPIDAPVDLVLLDLSINDGWAYNDHYLGKKQPQPRNDNTPATVQEQGRLDTLRTAVQVIARHVTSLKSNPAVISIQAFRDYPQHKPSWCTQEWVWPIVEPYGIHMVSYRDAVWPIFEQHDDAVSTIFWESYDGIHITPRSVHACY